ncbi:uncharacterized protein KY384_006442 [Bacidia gigantensis]|uniref:uncharacterized protein n=1 Tax=Bacidia gigantensis TaxID=2732470 RepID=UPI001D0501FA|nr:uncharacterized protein KY384_006442 [Bacidia gigantensis]KAG8528755.1 hypothetical protein KY384_006442 [Bacidia gigantensis]
MDASVPYDDDSSETKLSNTGFSPDGHRFHERDFMDDDAIAAWLAETASTSSSKDSRSHFRRAKRANIPPRNPPILSPLAEIESCDVLSFKIYRGTAVELQDGSFLRVSKIIRNTMSSEVTLWGWRFLRTKEVYGFLPNKVNETCWIVDVDIDDSREPREQAIEAVEMSEVLRRRGLRLTNRQWPDLSFRDDPKEDIDTVYESRVLVCRWKYITLYTNSLARTNGKWSERALIRLRESECDSSQNSSQPDDDLRQLWRGKTIRGGACQNWLLNEKLFLSQEQQCDEGLRLWQSLETSTDQWPLGDPMERGCVGKLITENDCKSQKYAGSRTNARVLQSEYGGRLIVAKDPSTTGSDQKIPGKENPARLRAQVDVIDLTDPQVQSSLYHPRLFNTSSKSYATTKRPSVERSSLSNEQRYTFADCFCGAGGVSRGAVMAGYRVNWAFDFSNSACESYSYNFFGTRVYSLWANDLVSLPVDLRVDVLHGSPPCPAFSPAHTREGKNDEMNTASQFAIFDILQKVRPRVVTLEQTAGLVQFEKHRHYFNSLIHMFTTLDYSIRWKLINFVNYGLPQRRLRLVIIAACSGEVLPEFPQPTHTKIPSETGLKPWVSINTSISNIPNDWPDHDVHGAIFRDKPSYSGDGIATCVTTTGIQGKTYHPSGKRDFTHRELACIQGFPLCHKFGEFGVKKQIGNAVPPLFSSILLEEIKKALFKADGLTVSDLQEDRQS